MSSQKMSLPSKKRLCSYYTSLLDLPEEIHAMIMASLDDLPTLQRLLIAFPWVAPAFSASFRSIIRTTLNRSLDEELRQYLYAVNSARYSQVPWTRRNWKNSSTVTWSGKRILEAPHRQVSPYPGISRLHGERARRGGVLPRILHPGVFAPRKRELPPFLPGRGVDQVSDSPCAVPIPVVRGALPSARGRFFG